jgi:hypothetical protein
MSKILCLLGLAISALLFFIFALDLITAFPFRRTNLYMDAGLVICGGALAYLSWNTFREQT